MQWKYFIFKLYFICHEVRNMDSNDCGKMTNLAHRGFIVPIVQSWDCLALNSIIYNTFYVTKSTIKTNKHGKRSLWLDIADQIIEKITLSDYETRECPLHSGTLSNIVGHKYRTFYRIYFWNSGEKRKYTINCSVC